SNDPYSRLATHRTLWPCSSRESHRCAPRKPAPPVTTEVDMAPDRTHRVGRSFRSLRTLFNRSAEVLVRLHVEPHREERELRARDQEQGDEHDRCRRDVVAAQTEHGLEDAERKSGERHHEAEEIEEDERVEVANDVLLAHPP